MSEETSHFLSLVKDAKYEEALLFLHDFHEQNSFRKLAINSIFDAATMFRDNNDDDLKNIVETLFEAIYPDTLKFRICFNFLSGRTTSHFAELLITQMLSLVSNKFIESNFDEWYDLSHELPMKLEENIIGEHDPNVFDSALHAAYILYRLRVIPFVLPKRMSTAFETAVHSREIEIPQAFPLLFYYSRTHPFSPRLLNITAPTTLVPCVYSRNLLGKYLMEGLTNYLHENDYNYEGFFVRPVLTALDHIVNTLENLDTSDIPLCTNLIMPLLRFIEDFQQHGFRVSIMKRCRELMLLFKCKPKVFLIKHVVQEILARSDLHLENEAAVVAWFVDLYRQHLDEKIFQEELGSFLGMLENTRYENMSLATNYYSSVFVLIQTLAIKRFNLEMLPEVETRIIRRVYEQLTDYIELEKMRKNNEESKGPAIPKLPDGFHFDVDPSIEASTVDQVQLLLFECEQARNYIVEALRKSTTGR
ncbi:hypothetical protein RB195_007299 [Necator americanus]|uniref:Glomulin n=1 Tax=Necator americanus TaxID=51031 RepID=A0ABR1BWJ9_NECAM